MAKRAVACRFLTKITDGCGKDGYYRRLAGLDDNEDTSPNDHDSDQLFTQLGEELDSDMSQSEMEKNVYKVERAITKRRKVCSYKRL